MKTAAKGGGLLSYSWKPNAAPAQKVKPKGGAIQSTPMPVPTSVAQVIEAMFRPARRSMANRPIHHRQPTHNSGTWLKNQARVSSWKKAWFLAKRLTEGPPFHPRNDSQGYQRYPICTCVSQTMRFAGPVAARTSIECAAANSQPP
jgi:hypothetical protein